MGATACIIYGLIFADSRAAFLAVIIGVLYLYNQRLIPKRTYLKAILALLILIFIVLLYAMRPNSADGRLFIWLNTCHMIADHPLWGTGTGGWLANYMHYQANYFGLHPDSCFASLADDVFYTYNEVLHWVAEHGLVGGLLLIFSTSILFKSENNRNTKALLLAYGVFACFSYPMDIFELQILLAVLLGAQRTSVIYNIPIRPKIYNRIVLPCTIGFGTYILFLSQTNTPSFYRYDARYLYYHVQRAMADKHTAEEKLSMLQHTAQIVPTCGLYTEMGDLWMKKEDMLQATAHYQTAANMVPCRMLPKYKLFILAIEQRNNTSVLETGRKILDLPVKRESTLTLRIKAEVLEHLDSTYRHSIQEYCSR